MEKELVNMRNDKPLIIIMVLMLFTLLMAVMGYAQLSDETIELVNDLRMKHYGQGTFIVSDENIIRITPKRTEYFFIIEDVEGWYNSSDYFINGRLKVLINGKIYWIRLEKDS